MNLDALQTQLYQHLITWIDTQNILNPTKQNLQSVSEKYLKKNDTLIPTDQKNQLVETTIHSILGLGPLEFFLQDESVTEIMVNGPDKIFVEQKGQLKKTNTKFLDEAQLLRVIQQIVGRIGRRIDESNPLVDARLADGSRVNAIIPPLSLIGPVLTIRKFPTKVFGIKDMIKHASLTKEMANYLEQAVKAKKNILISGGTGAGKTSTLNALANFIPPQERIITIEDAAEIRIDHPHIISLESRPDNIEGTGSISIRVLLKNALRMRPDRIVVGEIRGGESIDMLQAMNTGHSGSLTTVHANSPLESLFRIETMVLMGDIELPIKAIRPQIISAIDLVVQQQRLSNGARKITHISEVIKDIHADSYQVKPIFWYEDEVFHTNL
jgi:pilus assembly protein CpaF